MTKIIEELNNTKIKGFAIKYNKLQCAAVHEFSHTSFNSTIMKQ